MVRAWRWTRAGIGLLVVLAGCAALPGLASATPFQRGDLFGVGAGMISEYSPAGHLVQSFAAPGAVEGDHMCFTPNGRRLVVVGVGLFDDAGRLLPSRWASVAGGQCVVDGSGHVYVLQSAAVGRYDIAGHLLASFPFTSSAATATMDLAPDECTMVIGGYGALGQGRVNVCTGVASGSAYFADELRILPDWSILSVANADAILASPSGQDRYYYQAQGVDDDVTTVLLDPDGRTFWSCCWVSPQPGGGWGPPYVTIRWDFETGAILWRGSVPTDGIYGPPLAGDADVESTVDSNPSGMAEAFRTRAGFTGQTDRLHLWVDTSSTASQARVGIYADAGGHPGALLAHGTIAALRPGSWNYANLPETAITQGQRYWIAVLAPKGSGTLAFRDTSGGGRSETSAQTNLTTLPAHWSRGASWSSSHLSGYAS